MLQRLRRIAAVVYVSAAAFAGAAQAAPYSDLVVFGDSLSDTGNMLSLTSILSPPPFPTYPGAEGRFSNGPVWVEHLATGLGLTATRSNVIFNGSAVVPIGPTGGQNYAFGDARTGLDGGAVATTGLLGQVIAWNGSLFAGSPTRVADPNALYVIAAGTNDMRDFRSNLAGANTPFQAALNVANAIGLLAQAGARNFLVSNLSDLGTTPEAAAQGLVPFSTVATLQFNAALSSALSILDAEFLANYGVDLDLNLLDLFSVTASIVADASGNGGALYGITNVTSPCIAPGASGVYFAPDSTDVNCGVSLFSDDLHPSAAAHRLVGQAALAALSPNEDVPEPASLALVAIALTLLSLRRGARGVSRLSDC